MTRLWILILSLVFIVSGCVMIYIGYGIVQTAEASEDWPTTLGTITLSNVEHTYDDIDGNIYRAEIEYEYIVAEKEYTNNQVTSLEVTTNQRSDAEAIVNKYEKGQSISVYYNPDSPQEALIEPGVGPMTWLLAIFGGAFVLVSSIIFLIALFVKF